MRDFDFLEPASIAEASRMLADLGDDCRADGRRHGPDAGHAPAHADADASGFARRACEALRGIDFDPQRGLRIGALARHADVARSPLVREHYPMLAEHGGTGGQSAGAQPGHDRRQPLLRRPIHRSAGLSDGARRRRWCWRSSRGERVLNMEEFLVDYFVTALEPDELVVEIRVPPLAVRRPGVYTRFLRTAAEHRPLASVALVARRDGALCREARLVVGASTPIPHAAAACRGLSEGRDRHGRSCGRSRRHRRGRHQPDVGLARLGGLPPRHGARGRPPHHRRAVRHSETQWRHRHEQAPYQLHRQRRGAERGGPGAPPAVGLPARRPAPDRHQARLRDRHLRRLLGAGRRRGRQVLPDRWPCRPRPRDHHRRRPGQRRRTASAAGELHAMRRSAMRLLHAGLSDGFVRAAGTTTRTRRRTKCGTASTAICAAAPAIPRSSNPSLNAAEKMRGN